MKQDVIDFLPIAIGKKIRHDSKLSIDEIIEMWNTRNGGIFGEISSKDEEYIKRILNNDTVYLDGFEFRDDYFQIKEYSPFEYVFETSGKLVVENDLRGFFKEESFDINGIKGIIQTMEHYAKQGMMHGFVGNSCPGVLLNESLGIIHIGAEYDDEEDDYIVPGGFKEVTSVCTDLWWYSIVDFEVLKSLKPEITEDDFTIIEIPPGKWKLTHKYGITERGYHENLPYATLELLK